MSGGVALWTYWRTVCQPSITRALPDRMFTSERSAAPDAAATGSALALETDAGRVRRSTAGDVEVVDAASAR